MKEQTFTIKKATRVGISPLIALYAESGCGKTMSALLLARGLAGPTGKIVGGDSESGRMSLYADVIPGGFETLSIEAPFTPEKGIAAIDAIEQSGAAAGILDSCSHFWEGIGGVIDMAAEIEGRSGKGLHCWKTPKFEHAKFVQRLLRTKIPFVVCLRAKHKTRQVKENGKTQIIKDDFTTPIQADDFIFEMTAHAEVMPDHSIHLTKCSHPSLRDCFPTEGPITIEHGKKLAQWCASAGAPPVAKTEVKPEAPTEKKPLDPLAEVLKNLWDTCEPVRGKEKKWTVLNAWLAEKKIIDDGAQVQKFKDQHLVKAIINEAVKAMEILP